MSAPGEEAPPALRDLLAVEHPCFVARPDKAMHTLGGITRIAMVDQDDSSHPLHCNLRPNDPLAHPLYGQKSKRRQILIKVSKTRRVTVVGNITHAINFRGLADIQYVSDTRLTAALTSPWQEDDKSRAAFLASHAISVPPSSFIADDLPHAFFPERSGVQKFAQKNKSEAREKRKRRRTRNRSGLAKKKMHYSPTITMHEKTPMGPPPNIKDKFKDARDLKKDALYQAIKSAFDTRPIWTMNNICHKLGIPNNDDLRYRIPIIAYTFKKGPWRMCYVRYGYDPRLNKESRYYQYLDIRMPQELGAVVPKKCMGLSDVNAPKRLRCGPSVVGDDKPNALPDEEQLPQQRVIYMQLCDLKSDEFRNDVYAELPNNRECDDTSGWYDQATIENIRKRVKEIYRDLAKDTAQGLVLADSQVEVVDNHEKDGSIGSSSTAVPLISADGGRFALSSMHESAAAAANRAAFVEAFYTYEEHQQQGDYDDESEGVGSRERVGFDTAPALVEKESVSEDEEEGSEEEGDWGEEEEDALGRGGGEEDSSGSDDDHLHFADDS